MPELPEVETVVRDLRPLIVGAVFEGISSSVPEQVWPSLDFFEGLKGRKVEQIERRGKFIVIDLEGEMVLTMHLRMSGRILARDHQAKKLKYERTRIDFDKVSLRFCDMRKFGRIWLTSKEDYEEITGIEKLGIEPFSEEFSLEKFKELVEGRKGALKKFLLDQRYVAGIGNIYADESCFYAGVRPDKEISKLDEGELEKLYESIVKALDQGIRNRGTSVSDYQDAYGKSGKNQELLYVYGRGGKPCMNCKTELTKVRLAGRGTVFCEQCQSK